MSEISMFMSRADLIKALRDPDYAGPMIHCRSWSELQVLMHRAADLLTEADEDDTVRDALAPEGKHGTTPLTSAHVGQQNPALKDPS